VSTGIHHFLLKPPSLSEIEFVVREVLQQLNESQERDELLTSYLQQQEMVRRSMKDAFFRDLLSTRYEADELPGKRIAFMGLPESTAVQALTLSLVRSDASARREEREWQLLRFGTGNIIREMLNAGLSGHPLLTAEVLEYSDQEFVVIFLSDGAPEADRLQFILQISDAMLKNILQYMKLSVLAGLGTLRRGYHQLLGSYLESRSAVEIAEMNEWNRVYAYSEQEPHESEASKNVSMDAVRHLHDAIFQKQWQLAYKLWSNLGAELAGGGVSLPVCKGVCSGIASALWTAAQASDIGEDAAGQGLEELLLRLNRSGSARQMIDWMEETVARLVARYREQQTGKRSNALVNSVIQDYIERCYHEELSLERIAASLHVNRNYLSQLFKRVTGEPFVNYLNNYRIRKAIELIGTGKYMVYEISERVGFQNSTYFSQVFKSITGYSPSEYNRL
jgi:AraC-like DNA-binding protein